MTLQATPLSPHIGAEISGVDLSAKLTDDTIAEIRSALLDHKVIFFRDQKLDFDCHKAFGRRFGELHVHPAAPAPEGHPELLVIHADESSKRVAGQGWHTDVSCDAEPPMASILYLEEVPEAGGDTLFSNMYAVYDALSDRMKDYLKGLTAVHSGKHVYRGRYYEDAQGARHEHPENEHPIVRTHPETGRQTIYVNEGFTTRIRKMNPIEGKAILDCLYKMAAHPEFQCRFKWTPGSVAFWDNRCVQHLAVFDYWPQVRHGVRVTIQGNRPFFQEETRPSAAALRAS